MNKNFIKSKKKLIQLHNYLNKWNLPISVIEKDYYLTPSQKAYLLCQIEIYDVLENEECELQLCHRVISPIEMSGEEQRVLLRKLNDLCPDLRKNLKESYRAMIHFKKPLDFYRQYNNIYEYLMAHEEEIESLEKTLFSLRYMPCQVKEMMTQYPIFKRSKEEYFAAKKKNELYLEEINTFRKNHPQYDIMTEQLVKANYNLVLWCIKNENIGYDDLLEEFLAVGLEALSKAILFYDIESDVQFSTYAVTVVGRKMKQYFNKMIRKKHTSLEAIYPMEEEFFNRAEMPLTFEDYEEIDEAEDYFLENAFYLENYEGDSPISLYEKKDLKIYLEKVLEKLQEKDRKLLDYLYGLTGGSPHTVVEASIKYGCSKQNMYQQFNRIKREIKRYQKTILRDYSDV